MIFYAIYIFILISYAGYCNGRMDYIKLHNLDKDSWRNKWYWEYVPLLKMKVRHQYSKRWYYFGIYKPKFKEAFPYSTTILVFLTDEWHFKKWLCFLSIEVLISMLLIDKFDLQWWSIPVLVIILKAFRGLGFTLNYDKK